MRVRTHAGALRSECSWQKGCLIATLLDAVKHALGHSCREFTRRNFVNIAPYPGFPWFNRPDEWMAGLVKVLSGVAIGG